MAGAGIPSGASALKSRASSPATRSTVRAGSPSGCWRTKGCGYGRVRSGLTASKAGVSIRTFWAGERENIPSWCLTGRWTKGVLWVANPSVVRAGLAFIIDPNELFQLAKRHQGSSSSSSNTNPSTSLNLLDPSTRSFRSLETSWITSSLNLIPFPIPDSKPCATPHRYRKNC